MIHLNEEEYLKIEKAWRLSTTPQVSVYARHVLLEEPVVVKHRNASADDFLSLALAIKRDIHAAAEAICADKTKESTLSEDLLLQCRKLETLMHQIYKQWLSE